MVTSAEVHDSQPVEKLLDDSDNGQIFSADSAYIGDSIDGMLKKRNMTGYRNHPLTEEQKKNNREKLRFRCRVKHIFCFIENSMNGCYTRSIGLSRAKEIIGLINLTYNLFRYEQVVRLQLLSIKH